VPVTITAIGGEELRERGITSVDGIAQLVPGLVLGSSGNALQGTASLRGIGSNESNDLGDQAVSYSLDDIQIAKGTVRRLSTFDIRQVEVLYGPQALFFGKNSPGGIISIHTADPTPTFTEGAFASYEANAQEYRGEGFVSGPLTGSLGARLALYGTTRRGWIRTRVPPSEPLAHEWGPRNDEFGGRLTLTYDVSSRFTARLKTAYSETSEAGPNATSQNTTCPFGVPQQAAGVPQVSVPGQVVDDCTADDRVTTSDPGPAFVAVDPRFGDGVAYSKQRQSLSSLALNYLLVDGLHLTSDTGYYTYRYDALDNFSGTYVRVREIAGTRAVVDDEFSEELRLTSSFNRMLNFTLGALYHRALGNNRQLNYRNANAPTLLSAFGYRQVDETSSLFGQIRVNPVPEVEVGLGARYTDETKRIPFAGVGAQFTPTAPPVSRVEFYDLSPEATVTWRPTENLTLYGAYKRGFLSGGFNTSAPPGIDYNYRPETVKGPEAGIKALWLDGRLRANLAFFHYDIQDLQVVLAVNSVSQIRNAARATTYGSVFDFSYRPPIKGLTLTGAVAYNHAEYDQYLATCYRGLPAPQCSLRVSPQYGSILSQDLSGAQVLRAPAWTGNAGINYRMPLMGEWNLGLSGDVIYSSSYFTDAGNRPTGRQESYHLLDAAVHLENGSWDGALIGNNLGNEFYITRGADSSSTGSNPGGAGTIPGDTIAAVSRGREVWLQLRYSF
jgi:iron complex outermembrane receptor protein